MLISFDLIAKWKYRVFDVAGYQLLLTVLANMYPLNKIRCVGLQYSGAVFLLRKALRNMEQIECIS